MPTCPICKSALANSREGYNSHLKRYHLNVTSKLQAVKHSGRSHDEIVADMANGPLAPFIITTGNEVAHLDACRCNRCFQAKLDALVAQTEETTNDLQSGIAGRVDSDELSAGGGADQA